MPSQKPGMQPFLSLSRRLAAAGSLALIVVGCTSSAATPAATATPVSATGTPIVSVAPGSTATATTTATATESAGATATAAPSATAMAAATATRLATPTPLPPLAIGLCTSAQLKLSIAYWIGDPGAGTVYAHVTAENVSSGSCNMRGTSQAQILNAGGTVIATAPSSAAKVSGGDPVYALAPNGTINTIISWGNWCHAAPTQKVKVAMVEPFGLGRIVASASGNAPIPTCYASGSASLVSSEAWLP
jgi:hypothetical protein